MTENNTGVIDGRFFCPAIQAILNGQRDVKKGDSSLLLPIGLYVDFSHTGYGNKLSSSQRCELGNKEIITDVLKKYGIVAIGCTGCAYLPEGFDAKADLSTSHPSELHFK